MVKNKCFRVLRTIGGAGEIGNAGNNQLTQRLLVHIEIFYSIHQVISTACSA
jgi:hypothetical protein